MHGIESKGTSGPCDFTALISKAINGNSSLCPTVSQVATRVTKELLKEIESIGMEEGADKATTLRRLLTVGVRQWKLDHALKLYREGRVTTARAATLAGLSVYEFIDVLREKRVPAQYTIEDLRADLKALA